MGILDGKVVLVTGGGNGIGRDCALIAAQEGAKVLVNDLGGSLAGGDEGSAGPAELVCQEIRAAGGEAVSNSESVTSLAAVKGMVQQALDAFGGLHAVINPAGILRDGMFHKMEESDWDKVIEVHLKGSFNVARATIEHFRDQNDLPVQNAHGSISSSENVELAECSIRGGRRCARRETAGPRGPSRSARRSRRRPRR